MSEAPIPLAQQAADAGAVTVDPRSVQALHRYAILDTPAEQDFDDIAWLAASICDTPISFITFVDADRQWFKSAIGVRAQEAPLHSGFCPLVTTTASELVIADAQSDPRYAANPVVVGEPYVRLYAGVPLITPEGAVIGTLCVVDRAPRQLSSQQIEALWRLSRQVMARLELRLANRQMLAQMEERGRLLTEQLAARERLLNAESQAQQEAEDRLAERRRSEAALAELARRHTLLVQAQQEVASVEEDLDAALGIVVRYAQEVTRATGAVVELVDGDEMVYRAGSGTVAPYMGLRLKRENSLSGACVMDGYPLRCADSETDPRVDRVACRRVGVRSMIVVPVQYNRITIGVLKVVSDQANVFPESDTATLQLFVGIIVTATSRVAELQARQALTVQDERLRLAIEGAQLGPWHWGLAGNELVWSDRCKALFGLAPDEPVDYARFLHIVHPEDRDAVHAAVATALETRTHYECEFRCVWPDGSIHWIASRGKGFYDHEGRAVRMEGIAVDFTERKQAQMEIEALNMRLKRMIQETHHRVKNNLQIISALVELQADVDQETVPVEALRRIGHHTRALATIHDLLTQESKVSGHIDTVSARAALGKLMPLLQATAGARRIEYEVDDMRIPVREGASLTLLVSELVSNAIKHGRGVIRVLFRVEQDTAQLLVDDDGPGFPSGFDPARHGNTGLSLIDSTGRYDLRGVISYENRQEGGARACVVFPCPPVTATTL